MFIGFNIWNNNESEVSPKLISEIKPHFQEAQGPASRRDARKMAPGHILKLQEIKDKKKTQSN